MKIYVASSWRNEYQSIVVSALRETGHDIYNFRNPIPGDYGFAWHEIDVMWQSWRNKEFRQALKHPRAIDGFNKDFTAMKWADVFVLVLPCGRSAHLELGWAIGMKKTSIVLLDDSCEPELMYKLVDHLCVNLSEVIYVIKKIEINQKGLMMGIIIPMEFEDNELILMKDGKFGSVIRTPTKNHPMVGIQVPDEEDIRWCIPDNIIKTKGLLFERGSTVNFTQSRKENDYGTQENDEGNS